jgi:hypothetical protein
MYYKDFLDRTTIAILAFFISMGGLLIAGSVSAAGPAAPKVDCTQKKNASKIECKEAPKSDVKPAVKKPEKVERKAPAAVQKKAAEENAKK